MTHAAAMSSRKKQPTTGPSRPPGGSTNNKPMRANDTATENRAGRIDRLDDPREGIAATYDRDNPAAWIRYEQALLVEVCDER